MLLHSLLTITYSPKMKIKITFIETCIISQFVSDALLLKVYHIKYFFNYMFLS
jgi:hypothetical protein